MWHMGWLRSVNNCFFLLDYEQRIVTHLSVVSLIRSSMEHCCLRSPSWKYASRHSSSKSCSCSIASSLRNSSEHAHKHTVLNAPRYCSSERIHTLVLNTPRHRQEHNHISFLNTPSNDSSECTHSTDHEYGASALCGIPVYAPVSLVLITCRHGEMAKLSWPAFIYLPRVSHPSSNWGQLE